jgi:hypothetical protein
MNKETLVKMEEWKIITPEVRNSQKAYSQDDITLGKLILLRQIAFMARCKTDMLSV